MTTAHFYAYRAYGDRAGTAEMTMQPDPGTGDEPHIHPAGVVMSFESEEQRDAYIAQQVVATTLPDGRDRRWHWVTPITPEQAQRYFEDCQASPSCIHKSHERRGRVRMPE